VCVFGVTRIAGLAKVPDTCHARREAGAGQAGWAQMSGKTEPAAPGAKRDGWLVVLIAGLMALNALAIDVMLPALDAIATSVHLTTPGSEDQNQQQLIIFAYVLGFGLPQLVWGPVTDRFGRRAPLVLCLVGYCVTALACSLIHTAGVLLAARFLQGVFAAGVRSVAVAVVRDLYEGREMARFMSMVMTIFMVVPIVAPLIGQTILAFGPWEALFYVLAAGSALLMVWAIRALPETLPLDGRRPLSLRGALKAYRAVLTHGLTFGYMAASGIIFGALFAFIASSQQIFAQVFGLGDQFALWFMVVAGAMAVANMLNARLVTRFGMRRLSHLAMVCYCGLSGALILVTLLLGDKFWIFMPLFTLTFACFGMMGSNFSAIALQPFGAMAGTASSAYGFATTTISALLGAVVGSQFDGTTLPLAIGLFVLGMTALGIVTVTERGRLFRPA
jgi:MFS transporter, DHA1 family, multidrug resistance protein